MWNGDWRRKSLRRVSSFNCISVSSLSCYWIIRDKLYDLSERSLDAQNSAKSFMSYHFHCFGSSGSLHENPSKALRNFLLSQDARHDTHSSKTKLEY